MKKQIVVFLLGLIIFANLFYFAFAQEKISEQLIVADFDSAGIPNNIGGDFGTWDYDPADETQFCDMSFYPVAGHSVVKGNALKLSYDVQSVRPAFNGFWMVLKGLNLEAYDKLSFWVRGDAVDGYTSRFKVELKNSEGKRAVYFVKDVTSDWGEVVIDFKRTRAITDWNNMSEFTVVFSDIVASVKTGVIYIDNISFLKETENK